MTKVPLEEYADILRASGDYRVLQRLEPCREFAPADGQELKYGIVLDTETCGKDPAEDPVLELGMARFSFSGSGQIHSVVSTFDRFNDPGPGQISEEISRLTSITYDMVEGQTISPSEVEQFVQGAVVVVAHHAHFDRRFVESMFPIFKNMAWACSYKEIDWSSEGHVSARLGDLLAGIGYFHAGHRADSDCLALLQILASPLPSSGRPALAALLERARKPTETIIVENLRNAGTFFKKRGYQWHIDETHRGWRLETSEFLANFEANLARDEFPAANITRYRVTAFTRHSDRLGSLTSKS